MMGGWCKPRIRPYRPLLTEETLERLKEKVRAGSYTGVNGIELDVVFRRFDKDGSGELDEAELRMALRRILRVPPSVISDAQISTLMARLDKGDSGHVSVTELIDFLGADSIGASQRTGKALHSFLETQEAADIAAEASARGPPGQRNVKAARPYRPPLKKEQLDFLRVQIKSASYTGVFGRQLDVVFGRFDKDGSGQLNDDEVRQALRRVLRIPPSALSDAQITNLCATLDADNSGSVSIQELVNFVGEDAEVSARTGQLMHGISA